MQIIAAFLIGLMSLYGAAQAGGYTASHHCFHRYLARPVIVAAEFGDTTQAWDMVRTKTPAMAHYFA